MSSVSMVLLAVVLASVACTHDDRTARTGAGAIEAPAKPPARPAAATHDPASSQPAPPRAIPKVVLSGAKGEAPVTVEVVSSPAARSRGLMYRDYLPPDDGMLFLFEEEEQQVFWMKNTLIPLDLIFIRADMTVLGVVENAEPLTTSGRSVRGESRYVLEVNGGWARAHGVAAGSKARFDDVL